MSNNSEKSKSKTNQDINHSKTIDCLKYCSNYQLLITSQQKNFNNYFYFSKAIISNNNNNNVFLINNISSTEIINTISEININNINRKFLISYDYESIFENPKNNINRNLKEEIIQFPIKTEKINLNFINSLKNIDNYRDIKGINLLIKYDLNEEKNNIILDKKIACNLLSFKMNAKIHEKIPLLDKDIFLLLNVKSIIKSIQMKLEYFQKKAGEKLDNLGFIFVPLIEYPNIGIIISVNTKLSSINIKTMKTNFNSIIKQKFEIRSILISINISSIFKKSYLELNNAIKTKSQNNKEKINNYINNDETTASSSDNSPKISYGKLLTKNLYYNFNINETLNNNFIFTNNNYLINNNINSSMDELYMNNNLNKICKENKFENISNNNLYYNNSNDQYKYISYENYYDINTIIINSNDIFIKTLFNRYQDKSNSTCNLIILIEFLKIKVKKPLEELTIFEFFSSFSKISALGLTIPFFNYNGNITKNTVTLSLNEIVLFIKSPKLIKRIEKELKLNKKFKEYHSSSKTSLNEENNEFLEIEGFEIEILEKKTSIKLSYKEKKPYYLRDSLFDKLEQLMNLFKSFKKIKIGKKVLINKSYISIEWNFINSINMLFSSFSSFHLFDGNFLGILPNIKDSERHFWINTIEEFDNKKQKIDYNYIIEENYHKINDFINNNSQ